MSAASLSVRPRPAPAAALHRVPILLQCAAAALLLWTVARRLHPSRAHVVWATPLAAPRGASLQVAVHASAAPLARAAPTPLTETQLDALQAVVDSARRVGDIQAGARACDRLLASPGTPSAAAAAARAARPWYTRPLAAHAPSAIIAQLTVEAPVAGWSLFNPSIVATRRGFTVLVRSSNYAMAPVTQAYTIPPADAGVIKTAYKLVRLTPSLGLDGAPRAVAAPRYGATAFPVQGVEDARLNSVAGRLHVVGNIRNAAGYAFPEDDAGGVPRMAAAALDGETGQMGHPTMLDVDGAAGANATVEKNWMPFIGRAGVWLYRVGGGPADADTTAVVSVAGDAATPAPSPPPPSLRLPPPATPGQDGALPPPTRTRVYVTPTARAPPVAREFRGGSGLVRLADGRWLGVVHEVSMSQDAGRAYEHRFVALRAAAPSLADARLVATSAPFYFRTPRTIEYCAGLAVRGGDVVMTYGHWDATAWVVRVALADVLAMLSEVNGPQVDEPERPRRAGVAGGTLGRRLSPAAPALGRGLSPAAPALGRGPAAPSALAPALPPEPPPTPPVDWAHDALAPAQLDALVAFVQAAPDAGEAAACAALAERALRGGRVPLAAERAVRAGRPRCTPPLAALTPSAAYVRLALAPPVSPDWTLFNPSIVATEAGYAVLVRSSNYRVTPVPHSWHSRYDVVDDSASGEPGDAAATPVRTTYLYVELTPDLVPTMWPLHVTGPQYAATPGAPVRGLEDAALVRVAPSPLRRYTVSGNARDVAGQDGQPKMVVADLDVAAAALTNARVVTAVAGGDGGAIEKNWMPFAGRPDEWLYKVWQHSGDGAAGVTTTVRLDAVGPRRGGRAPPRAANVSAPPSVTATVTRHAHAPIFAREFRGGSGLVPLPAGCCCCRRGAPGDDGREAAACARSRHHRTNGGGWLAIVHEVSAGAAGRAYEHRFVRLEAAAAGRPPSVRVASVSPPFHFKEVASIEYGSGLALRRRGADDDGGQRSVGRPRWWGRAGGGCECASYDVVASFGLRDAEAWLVRVPLCEVVGALV